MHTKLAQTLKYVSHVISSHPFLIIISPSRNINIAIGRGDYVPAPDHENDLVLIIDVTIWKAVGHELVEDDSEGVHVRLKRVRIFVLQKRTIECKTFRLCLSWFLVSFDDYNHRKMTKGLENQ